MCPVFCDFSFNQKNIFTYIDTVYNRLFTGIFADDIFIKKGKSSLIWCSSQPNDKRIKIGKHLTPHIINRAMTFVHNNTIKKFWRIFCIIYHFFWRLGIGSCIFCKGCFLSRFIQFFTFEDRIHSLNRADANLNIRRNIRRFQSTYSIKLRKRSGIIIWCISKKFTLCLFSKTFGIHQK